MVHAGTDAADSRTAQNQLGSKRQKGSSNKRSKTQTRHSKKAVHANIHDWSSDDSQDAAPVPMPDQLDSMSDSDDDKGQEAAAEAAATARKAKTAAANVRTNSKQQKGEGRKRKGGSSKGQEKKKLAKKTAAAPAKVTDWTSDDSSDGRPLPIADQLDSMSDSDSDTQAAGQAHTAAAGPDAAAAKQASKRHANGRTSKLSAPGNAGSGASPIKAVAEDEQQPAEHAKRKRRLRKARASPDPGQQAEVLSLVADDIMVQLEDEEDVPELGIAHPARSGDGADILSSSHEGQQTAAAGKGGGREPQAQAASKRKSLSGQSSEDR